MLLSSSVMGKIFDLAGEKHMIQVVSGCRVVGQTKYYLTESPRDLVYFNHPKMPQILKDMGMIFYKVIPYVPKFYDWPMSFDRNRLPTNYKSAEVTDYSQYGPGEFHKIVDNLALNMQKDFVERHIPVPLDKFKLYKPHYPNVYRPVIAVSGVGAEPIGTNIDFDHILDGRLINQYQFRKDDHPALYRYYTEKPIGWVLFTDPTIRRPINKAIVQYYSPFGDAKNRKYPFGSLFTVPTVGNVNFVPGGQDFCFDAIDVIMEFLGYGSMKDKDRNILLRKLAAYEIGKQLISKYNIDVRQIGNQLCIMMPRNVFDAIQRDGGAVSGIFGDWMKKIVKAVEDVGKKIEKHVTTPIRNAMKKAGIWKSFDKFQKRLGLEKTAHKFGAKAKQVLNSKKGEQLFGAAMAAMAGEGAKYVGLEPADAVNYMKTAVKTYDVLKDGNIDKQVMEILGKAAPDLLSKGDLTKAGQVIMKGIKSKLVAEKGPTEGVKSFSEFMNVADDMFKDVVKEGKKSVQEIQKKAEEMAKQMKKGNLKL